MRHLNSGATRRAALAILLAVLALGRPTAQGPTDLFFSEYIEGSSNNKALEIYNGTGAPIDLAAGGYNIQMFFNGSASAGLTINLTGTVANGDVHVVAQSSANAVILAQADQTNGSGWYNGDDAVVLRKGTTVLDVIGQIGFDPGTEWGTGLTSTADNTLRRKTAIYAGDTDGSNAFDPSAEWDGFAVDTFDGLGTHAFVPQNDAAPTVTSVVPANGAAGVPTSAVVTVTFSEPVNVTGDWFAITCSGVTTTPATATVTGGPTTFTIDPATDFVPGACQVTVAGAQVSDQDADDPPDAMVVNFTSTFTAALPVDPCTLTYTPTYAIQGSGTSAAITGTVTTFGVVIGDYEGPSPTLRGFYIQDPSGDGNPATSDGLFVFNGNKDSVALGQLVRVTGTATEFQDQTQVSASSIVSCGTGSVAPVDVTLPVASATALEAYEGMLVRLPQTLSVTEHFQLGRFGQVTLSADGRLPQPTEVALPGAPAQAVQAANALNRILLDDELQNQNRDPIVFARNGLPLSADNTLRGGDTATGIVGVLSYTWAGNAASGNAFRVRPIGALGGTAPFVAANPRPTTAPAVGGTVRVASANVLNFFNTFDGCTFGVGGEPADCRGANTAAELERQAAKLVSALLATGADVIGLIEIENDGYAPGSALADLVERLDAATAPGTWAFIDADAGTGQVNALGTDAIKSALVYKKAVVTPVGQTAVLNTGAFGLYVLADGRIQGRNRPALAQSFQAANGARVTVVVNHYVSKGAGCDLNVSPVGPDPDTGDGQGLCNQTRVAASTELAAWLATDPTATADADVLLLGDFNAYAKEDPIAVLTGAAYTDLVTTIVGAGAYSYAFDGQWGSLDHALASPSLAGQVTGVGVFHINADEPSVLDYNVEFKSPGHVASLYAPDMYRMSDHDPIVVGLDLRNDAPVITSISPPATITLGQSTLLEAVAYDPDGGPVTYAWDLDNDGTFETDGQSAVFPATAGVGAFPVHVRATDVTGLSATASTTVTVVYQWTGFFAPLVNPPAVTSAKAGRALPVKFSLDGDQGLGILAVGFPVSLEVDCTTLTPAPGASETATANPGGSGLTYDASTATYTYVWKTEKAWAGSCRVLSVRLVDGSTHEAYVRFK